MFKANTVYTNRYNDTYTFKQSSKVKTYQFIMNGDSMKYCRWGCDSSDGWDEDKITMFDPSGGPYVTLGMCIDEQPIERIWVRDENVFVEVA